MVCGGCGHDDVLRCECCCHSDNDEERGGEGYLSERIERG